MRRLLCLFEMDKSLPSCSVLCILLYLLRGPPTPLSQIPLNSEFGCSEFLDSFLNEELMDVSNNTHNMSKWVWLSPHCVISTEGRTTVHQFHINWWPQEAIDRRYNCLGHLHGGLSGRGPRRDAHTHSLCLWLQMGPTSACGQLDHPDLNFIQSAVERICSWKMTWPDLGFREIILAFMWRRKTVQRWEWWVGWVPRVVPGK